MDKLQFDATINASAETVWNVLWSNETYPQWTSVFSEGSRAESDWKEGSKILFTDGKGSGMVSKIDKMEPNEYMAFRHLGELRDGVEDVESDKVKDWKNATETYTLSPAGSGTHLLVQLEVSTMQDYFNKTFPMALLKVKQLSEAGNGAA